MSTGETITAQMHRYGVSMAPDTTKVLRYGTDLEGLEMICGEAIAKFRRITEAGTRTPSLHDNAQNVAIRQAARFIAKTMDSYEEAE